MSNQPKYVWTYDIEVAINFFSVVYRHEHTYKTFYHFLDGDKNKVLAHQKFLANHVSGLVGFNNLSFDAPVLEFFIKHGMRSKMYTIYDYAQRRIEMNKTARNLTIPNLDLYKLWHFDNRAREIGEEGFTSGSLKWIAFSLRWPNMMDINFDHAKPVTNSMVADILRYNRNDVDVTYKLYDLSNDKIALRRRMADEYGFNTNTAVSWPDTTLGEELLLRLYCRKTGNSTYRIKQTKAKAMPVTGAELLVEDYRDLDTALVKKFRSIEIDAQGNGSFKHSYVMDGHIRIDYGLGGVHAARRGEWRTDDEYTIYDIDVASLYPSLGRSLNAYMRHLGPEFLDVYSELIDERLEAKRNKDYATSDALKLALNGAYGKSNSEWSWLYDPHYTFKVTLNGQLMLTRLCEALYYLNPDKVEIIQLNTDGITIYAPTSMEEGITDVMKDWEAEHNLTLELQGYSYMGVRDVNNYLAVKMGNKGLKAKGAYEIDPMVGKEPALHKDNSMRVVKMAAASYLIHRRDPMAFLKSHVGQKVEGGYTIPHITLIGGSAFGMHGILDFCLGAKTKGNSMFIARTHRDGELVEERLDDTVRYYMSKRGVTIMKFMNGKYSFLHKVPSGATSMYQTLLQKARDENHTPEPIDYEFYLRECHKLINGIRSFQTSLFQ